MAEKYGTSMGQRLYLMKIKCYHINNSSKAASIAMTVFDPESAGLPLDGPENHGIGMYWHYHPKSHQYKGYKHIHFWYGRAN